MTPKEAVVRVSAELVAELVAKTLSALNPIQSEWSFSSFDTSGFSLEIGGIGLGASASTLKLKQAGKSAERTYNCLSLDAGVGTPHPVPLNFTFPLPKTPGAGIVFRLPRAFGELTPNDFRGGFCACSYSAQCGVGGGLTVLFMGSAILPNSQNMVMSFVKDLLTSCKAVIVCAGLSGSLIPGSAGAAYSIGGSI